MANADAQAGMLGVARAIASRDRGEADLPMRRTVAAGMLAAVGVAVLATIPGRVDRSSEIRGDFPRTADSSGSLHAASGRGVREDAVSSLRRDDMKSTVAGLAIAVASTASAVPPGWVLVADSQAQFSGVQGQDGWRYLFDRGEGTAVEEMPYAVPYNYWPDYGGLVWCAAPVTGDAGSFCIVARTWSHTNQGYACTAPQAGLQRPIRQWDGAAPGRILVSIATSFGGTNTSALRADLLVDGSLSRSWSTQYGSMLRIDADLEFASAQVIRFRLDPVDGCGADACHDFNIRIYAPDCDGHSIADRLQISANPAADSDSDGILDQCECAADPSLPFCCPGDLTRDGQVTGADIGAVLAFWGPNPAYAPADINGDGRVDGSDLGLLLSSWGPCGQ
jgi:hypothetical protein